MLTLAIILFVLFIFFLFLWFFYIIIEGKLDWTKENELLLWYSEIEEGRKVRKFLTIIKL